MGCRYIFIVILLCRFITSFAQGTVSNYYDTLTANEKIKIVAATRNSAFGYYALTDSFSQKGDSVNASISLLKIDPYYFLFQDQKPDSSRAFIARHFKLINAAIEKYAGLYSKAYNSAKSESYSVFKAMYDEDIAAKRFMENCGDSLTCNKAANRIRTTDSIHFDYLYNYITKNGWPSLSNGAMYANILVLHDHLHYDYYVPLLKKAVIKGYASLDILELMMQARIVDNGTYAEPIKRYFDFEKLLKTHVYRRVDISSMLSNRLPSSLSRIEKAVAQLCPAKLFYFYEAKDKRGYNVWESEQMKLWMSGVTDDNGLATGANGMLPGLTFELSHYMCPTKNLMMYKAGLSNCQYHPSENTAPKLILYIIQGEKEK